MSRYYKIVQITPPDETLKAIKECFVCEEDAAAWRAVGDSATAAILYQAVWAKKYLNYTGEDVGVLACDSLSDTFESVVLDNSKQYEVSHTHIATH